MALSKTVLAIVFLALLAAEVTAESLDSIPRNAPASAVALDHSRSRRADKEETLDTASSYGYGYYPGYYGYGYGYGYPNYGYGYGYGYPFSGYGHRLYGYGYGYPSYWW